MGRSTTCQTFWEEDVHLTRSLPVHAEMEDVVGWHFDCMGRFSVRSAYKVHRTSVIRKQQQCRANRAESSRGTDDFWKPLWKIQCPPKVKHFLRRLSHNTLAVRKILQRRGMKLDTRCCMCEIRHLLLKCKEARAVWRELNLEETRCQLAEAGSAKELMECVLALESKKQLTAVMLLWLWWGERNKFREEKRRRGAAEIAYITAFHADQSLKEHSNTLLSENCQTKRWERPPQGVIKINSDGVFDSSRMSGGWGYVVRNDQGEVVTAGAGREDFLLNAFHSELLGCLAGLKQAANLGIASVYWKDATLVLLAMEDDDHRLSAMGGVITEIKHVRVSEFC